MRRSSILAAGLLCFSLLSPLVPAEEVKTAEKSWKDMIKLGVEDRFRYEYKSNFDFDSSRDDKGDLFFNRLRANCRIGFTDKAELFVEGMDSRVSANDIKKPAQADEFDLYQGYLDFQDILDLPLEIKIGRQEMKYGKGRLISSSTWANRLTSFDAGILRFKKNGFYADAFYGQIVQYDEIRFNNSSKDLSIKGIYCGYQAEKDAPQYEAYYINNINVASSNDVHRHTTGARTVLPVGMGWTADLEGCYQFGEEGPKDVSAYALHADASRTFEDAAWKPKVAIEYNYASGDKNSKDNKINTFVPVYQTTHDPYGLMDFFKWQNMQEFACRITLQPVKKFKVIPEAHCFFLANTDDYWYTSSGSKLRTPINGNADSYAGTELSLVLKYEPRDYIALETGYAHFIAGSYLNDTGAGDDADWAYASVTAKF